MLKATFRHYLTSAVSSREEYPIKLSEVWEALGYARKDNAVRAMKKSLEEAEDYMQCDPLKSGVPFHPNPEIEYLLTKEAFKHLCMMANTAEGKETRKYYLKIEKEYQKLLTDRLFGVDAEVLELARQMSKLISGRTPIEYAYNVTHVRATFGFVSDAYTIVTIEAELDEGEDYIGEGGEIMVCRQGLHKLSVSLVGEIKRRSEAVETISPAVLKAIRSEVKAALKSFKAEERSISLEDLMAAQSEVAK